MQQALILAYLEGLYITETCFNLFREFPEEIYALTLRKWKLEQSKTFRQDDRLA